LIEADAKRRSSEADEQAALDQPLQVERDVEARRAKLPAYREDAARALAERGRRARAPPAPGIDGDDAGEGRMAGEHRRPAPLDDPRDTRLRNARGQRGCHRQRVDDVTERGELDERDVHRKRSRIAAMKSRVE